jgi:hypothetical protein
VGALVLLIEAGINSKLTVEAFLGSCVVAAYPFIHLAGYRGSRICAVVAAVLHSMAAIISVWMGFYVPNKLLAFLGALIYGPFFILLAFLSFYLRTQRKKS